MNDSTQRCIELARELVLRSGEAAGQAHYIEASLRGHREVKDIAPGLGDLEGLAAASFRDVLETFEQMVRIADEAERDELGPLV